MGGELRCVLSRNVCSMVLLVFSGIFVAFT